MLKSPETRMKENIPGKKSLRGNEFDWNTQILNKYKTNGIARYMRCIEEDMNAVFETPESNQLKGAKKISENIKFDQSLAHAINSLEVGDCSPCVLFTLLRLILICL